MLAVYVSVQCMLKAHKVIVYFVPLKLGFGLFSRMY